MRIVDVAKALGAMAYAPLRIRRHAPALPQNREYYDIPSLASNLEATTTKSSDIPVAKTPPGRWKDWPPLVLVGCDEPLVDDAPDLRGVWQCYKGPLKGHVERNEQAGNRVVITGGGVIHDMFADGTLEGGVQDEGVGGARIAVAARFENGRLNLYLNNKRLVVTRYRDGDDLIWRWGPYLNRLRRLTGPDDPNRLGGPDG